MNLDDLKDQVQEFWNTNWAKFQESSFYIQISEKYENLAPNEQRLVAIIIPVIVALILLAVPYSLISSSQTEIDFFTEQRDLIREIFKVSRQSDGLVGGPRSLTSTEIQERANRVLAQAQLASDQIQLSSYEVAEQKSMSIELKSVIQSGVEVTLSNLNLRQVVDIGQRLQRIDDEVTMVGLKVTATDDDPHYFNVTFQLVSFSLPEKAEPVKKARKT